MVSALAHPPPQSVSMKNGKLFACGRRLMQIGFDNANHWFNCMGNIIQESGC